MLLQGDFERATSELHTALKIAPVYGAPVVWMKDASQNASAASRLLSDEQRSQYSDELSDRYSDLRQQYSQRDSDPIPLEEARRRRPKLF